MIEFLMFLGFLNGWIWIAYILTPYLGATWAAMAIPLLFGTLIFIELIRDKLRNNSIK